MTMRILLNIFLLFFKDSITSAARVEYELGYFQLENHKFFGK